MSQRTLLVVEDDPGLQEAIVDTLELSGYHCVTADCGEAALVVLQRQKVDMIISDVQMPGMDGLSLLQNVQHLYAQIPMLLMTAFGNIEGAVRAMRDGAVDYLVKPFAPEVLLNQVSRYVPAKLVERRTPVYGDPRTAELLQLAAKVARSDASVMISGPSGTGKEVLARYIHDQSSRSEQPFIAINCAAIPENMLEATLFGYEKGAFTGAVQGCPGKFEQAQGGTLLLDEITEMDPGLQANPNYSEKTKAYRIKPVGLLFMSNKLCNKLSNKTPSYLTVRNGIYYFCYRLPVVISPDKTILIRHSLRTKSPVIAQQRVANLLPLVYSAKQEAENRYTSIVCDANKTVSNNVISGEVPVSKEESANDVELLDNRPIPDKYKEFIHQYEIRKLTALLKNITQMCEIAFKDGAAKQEMTPDEYEDLSKRIYRTITKPRSRGLIKEDQRQVTIKKYLSNQRVRELLSSVSDEKTDVLAVISKMVDIDIEINAEKVKLITAYCSAQEQQYDSTTAKLESKLNRLLTEQIQVINTNEQLINNNDVTSQVPDSPAISHFIPDFLSWDERNRDVDTINTYKRDLEFIIRVIGDKPINQVTKQDIRETLKVKELMPKMNLKPYKDYGVDFVINAVVNDTIDIPDEHRLASKSVKATLKSFQSFFSAYLFKELDLLEKSPTENVTVKYKSYPYANYTDPQMDLIVNHYKQQEISDKQLVMLTACYTGMRLSEICSLTSDSIGLDDESGYHYIFIEKGKTEAARRLIPISKKLESTGLISFLQDLKGKELFSKKVDLINDDLRKTRELLSIPHENEYEQRRVFHSVRHSVITKIRSHGITDALLQKVVGHETKKSITDRYTHEYAVKNLIHVVECLPW